MRAFPGGNDPAVVAIKADDVTLPAGQDAIVELKRQGARVRPDERPDRGRGEPRRAPSRRSTSRSPATAPTTRRRPRSRPCATTCCPQHARAGRRRRVRRHRQRPRWTSDWEAKHDRARRRSSSASCSCSPSCSCSSRSARSSIAVKAILLNLLSVGAAYGVLVAHLPVGLGREPARLPVERRHRATGCPMFMFVILFGLSMDYHVFILSRVREAYDRGLSTERRGRPRDQVDGRRGHQRRGRDGRRLLGLRAAAAHRHEGDGHRPRGRRPDRRDASSARVLLPGDDEAARRRRTGTCRSWLEWLPRLEHEPSRARERSPCRTRVAHDHLQDSKPRPLQRRGGASLDYWSRRWDSNPRPTLTRRLLYQLSYSGAGAGHRTRRYRSTSRVLLVGQDLALDPLERVVDRLRSRSRARRPSPRTRALRGSSAQRVRLERREAGAEREDEALQLLGRDHAHGRVVDRRAGERVAERALAVGVLAGRRVAERDVLCSAAGA